MPTESGQGWFFRVEDLPTKEVLRGIHIRSVHLENLMMTFIEYPAETTVPAHYHPFEQITYVLEGVLEVTVAGEQRTLRAGEGVCIRPNAEHASRPIDGPARVLDAWTPVPEHFKPDES
jgi:quercetin dioxygenase-like cupin family protein